MLGKRKRASSEPCPSRIIASSPTPLTVENLVAHERMTSPTKSPSKKSSHGASIAPSSSTSTTISAEAYTANFRKYNIHVNEKHPMPADLDALLKQLSTAERVQISPNAKKVIQLNKVARQHSEATAISILDKWLGYGNCFEEGLAYIMTVLQPNLATRFLPGARQKSALPLRTPQPDVLSGFIPNESARSQALPAPFNPDEESILAQYRVCKGAIMPFFTSQYKSTQSRSGLVEAREQAVRDGATIVHATHAFFEAAGVDDISVVDTCHISMTCDFEIAWLWIHWRRPASDGEIYWEMDKIALVDLGDEAEVALLRKILRNWWDHVVTVRLPKIRAAIERLQSRQRVPDAPTVLPGLSLGSRTVSTEDHLPTPAADTATSDPEPPRKRLRTDEGAPVGAEVTPPCSID